MRFRISTCVTALVIVVMSSAAGAVEVNFQSNGFLGNYQILGEPVTSGVQTLDLTVGAHTIKIGNNFYGINVAANGDVTTSNPDSLSVSNGQVALKTATVNISANGFDGVLRGDVTLNTRAVSINDTTVLTVVKGSSHFLDNGYSSMTFDVDAAGVVSSTSPNSLSATGTDSTLALNTQVVTFDANGYVGQLSGNMMKNGRAGDVDGPIVVIKDTTWSLGTGASDLTFSVDAAGEVSFASTFDNALQKTGTSSIQLQTAIVHLDPNGFGGVLRGNMFDGGGAQANDLSNPAGTDIVVIKDLRWGLNNGLSSFYFNVDENGLVSEDGGNAVSASGADNVLTFNTTELNFDGNGFDGLLRGNMTSGGSFTSFSSETFLTVINDMGWSLNNGYYSISLDVDENGSVTSLSPGSVTASGQLVTFDTVLVEVDPTNYLLNYNLGGFGYVSGITQVTMIKELANQLGTANDATLANGKLGFFTPFDTYVAPSSLDLLVKDVLGNEFLNTFNFSVVLPQTVPGPASLLIMLTGMLLLVRRNNQLS